MTTLYLVTSIIIGIAGVAYILGQFFRGKSEGSSSLLRYLTDQNKGYEQALKDIQEQRAQDNKAHAVEMEQLRGQIKSFQEMLKVKDEVIEKQNKIIENRNPELENFMKVSLEFQDQMRKEGTLQLSAWQTLEKSLEAINEHMRMHNAEKLVITKQ